MKTRTTQVTLAILVAIVLHPQPNLHAQLDSGKFRGFVEILDEGGSSSLALDHPGNLSTQLVARTDGEFRITDETGTSAFEIKRPFAGKSLVLDRFGVGIGVYKEPVSHTLQIYSDDFSPFVESRILVENDLSETKLRTMFELVNNGPTRFELSNTSTDQTWAFQTNNADGFLINRLGSGGNEFSIRKSGMVTMGPGGVRNFTLHPNGDVDILGTLSQLSDRNAKENFQTVDTQEVLRKVAELPVSVWNYKDDVSNVRHMGPMAQDFRKAFQLGKNDKSIASVDTTGVMMAAIQALHQNNGSLVESIADRDEQIAILEESNAVLEQRMAALESMVASLK